MHRNCFSKLIWFIFFYRIERHKMNKWNLEHATSNWIATWGVAYILSYEKKKPIGMAFIAASRPIFKWLWWAVPYLFFSIYFSVQMINYSVHRIWHWMIIIVCAWFDQQASMISHQTSTTIKAGKNHWNHFEYNIITNWFSGIGWMNGLAFVN